MINKDNKLFKWGPIDGKPIYINAFNKAFVGMKDRMGYSINDLFNYFKDGQVTIVAEDKKLKEKAIPAFNDFIMDETKVKVHFEEWTKKVHQLRAFEEIVNHGLGHMDDAKLLKFFKEWYKAHLIFWDYGFLPELANWGGEKLLMEKVNENWPEHFNEIFESLSAPERLSFFQNEELDFLGIALLQKDNMKEIMLHDHAKRYYWLKNSYGETSIVPFGYFEEELKKLNKEKVKARMVEIDNYPNKVKARKKEIIERYNIDDETLKIANKLAYCLWWQDHRKMFIFIANHINTAFLEEISIREEIDIEDLVYYTEDDIIGLLENNDVVDVEKRKEAFVLLYENDELKYLEGNDAKNYVKPYFEEKEVEANEVDGMVVSIGEDPIIEGKVRILKSPSDLGQMQKGEILVAPMTSPDYIEAMRKASAIVTDEGGMTSHAAILSRELGIACIVATEIATKIFKDGDTIEIDTDKGIVRRIE